MRPGYHAWVHGVQHGWKALRDGRLSPSARLRLSGGLLAAMYLGSTAAAAYGQTTAPATPVVSRAMTDLNCMTSPACLALFEQAQQQSKSGQLAEALHSYSLAYQVVPDPRLLFSLGRVRHKQGQFAEAISYYRKFLASDSDDEAQKATARSLVAQCEAVLPPPSESPARPVVNEPPVKSATPKPLAIHQRWWFWTLIGGVAAAGIAGGIAGGVVAQQNRLPDLTFRPFE